MKPAFALDFRNDAIALLHRTPGGWHQVGRVPLDEPDLPGALSYLRATALGLSPRGLATKLILPDDQILVTSVEAPGPDEASRLAQIRTALEGLTPYGVEDLVFDWEEVNGEVRVAVIAQETLAEAEGFAAEHRFNPVSFAAAPAAGFAGEPWFGLTALAADLLTPGETVEREIEPTAIVDRGALAGPEPEPEPDADLASEAAESVAPQEPEADALALDASATIETAAVEPSVTDPAAVIGALDQDGSDPVIDDDVSDDDVFNGVGPDTHHEPVEAPPLPAFDPKPKWQPEPMSPRGTPIFGLADDEPTPSTAFRAFSERRDGRPDPEIADSGVTDPSGQDLPDDLADALQGIGLEQEAPMAVDVEEDTGAASAAVVQQNTSQPAKPGVTDPSVPEDVPSAPGYNSAMGFASRRASADAGQSAKAASPAPRPIVDRPTAARPLVAPPPPKTERPGLNRPTAARPVAPKETKGLRGLGAFVTAPGLPGTGRKKVQPPVTNPAAKPHPATGPAAVKAQPAQGTEATKGLGRGLGSRPVPVRGKPRHLGLILTGLLLLILALIAAWSTSLAFRTDDGATTELAALDVAAPAPGIEDEMLADGEDPVALAVGEALPAADDPSVTATPVGVETPATDPAPAVGAAEETAAVVTAPNPGATSGDEIFLAAKDLAPVAPEPLDLPEVSAQGDPLPSAQAPPPPFGTVYQFDANGLIVPTPEGIITPEGVRLVAGKPPLVPKTRPEGLAPPQTEAVAVAAVQSATAPVEPVTEATAVAADPALAGFRPKARPAGLTPPAVPAEATVPQETAPGEAAPVEALPDDAALFPAADSRLVGLRPQARPEAVLAAGEAARAASSAAAASLAAQAETAAPASKLAVAISRKPAPRPRDLSRAVEAAVAAAIRAPEPAPEPEPEQVASVQPAKSPQPKVKPAEQTDKTVSKSPARGKDAEIEAADEEPELASSARSAPSGSVAKQATFKNALNLEKTALIGVYGTPASRYAMIRTSNGRYKKVKIGDSLDGGKIKAITATEVRYQKGSKLVTLALPKG